MADGVVTGEYRLTTVQARRELERLQREGRRTDVEMERLGQDLDHVGDRQQQRNIRSTSTETRRLGVTSRSSSRDVDRLATTTGRLATSAERASAAIGGGRARGGGGGTRLSVGGLSGGIGSMAAKAVVALPVIRALTGAVGGLAAVATSAAGGAGAVGVAGISGMVTGIAGIAAVAMPAAKRIGEIADAQKKYNETLREYGKRSKEAREARGELRGARSRGPAGAGALVLEAQAFSRAWNRATASGQRDLVSFLREVIATGRRMRAPLAEISNQVTAAFTGQGRKFLRFTEGDRIQKGLKAGGGIFSENLGNVRRVGQATVEMFLNISRAARPFLKEFTDFSADWFGRGQERTRNIRQMRLWIGGMVDDLKSVGRLGGAGMRLLGALFGGARPAGQTLLESATATLDRWTAWLNRNPAKVQAFFRQAADDATRVASAVGAIVEMLWKMGGALRPLLPLMTGLVTAASSVASFAGPGVLAAGLGAFRGARGTKGPGVLGTAANLIGLGGLGRRGGGGAPVPGRMTGGSPLIIGRAPYSPRGSRTPTTPRGRMPTGAWTGAQMAGGAVTGTGGRAALGVARTAAAGAAKAFWPIAAGMAALGAATTQGGFNRRAQGAGAMLLPGIVNTPESFTELQAQGAQRVGGYTPHGSLRMERGGLAQSGRDIRALRERLGATKTITRSGMAGPRQHQVSALGEEERERVKGQIAALKEERDARRDVVGMLREEKAMRQVAAAPGEQRDIRGGFRIRRKAEGFDVAAEGMRKDVMRKLRRLEPEGQKALAEANLTWLREQRKRSPAFRKLYDDMANRIEKRWQRMGKHIQVVNGKIVGDTGRAWRDIRDKLTSATERAKQEQQEDFTAMQKNAVNALSQMGWTRSQATKIVAGQEAGGFTAKAVNRAAGQNVSAYTNNGQSSGGGGLSAGSELPRARGGRIGGRGLRDTVPVGDGGLAAPGELIVNRHTEASHDADARSHGLPTLGQRVKHERRPHSAPKRFPQSDAYRRARGGRINLMGANQNLAPYAAFGQQFGLTVSSGARPGSITSSGNVSLHSSGNALDMSGSAGGMLRYARAMASRFGAGLDELIHTPMGFGIKNGQRIGSFGAAVDADHFDHAHVGDRTPGGAGGIPVGGASSAATLANIRVRPPGTRQRGVPGGMVTGSNRGLARGLQKSINAKIGAGAGGGGGGAAGGNIDDWLRQALRITGHLSPGNLSALRGRAMQESGGDPRAVNNWDSNAAAGIPSKGLLQTIGPTFDSYKLAGMNNIFNPVHNAVAAIRYMMAKYGHIVGPSGSGYSTGGRVASAGWFRNGGSFTTNGPTVFGAGEAGRENVTISRKGSSAGRPIMVNITMGTVKVASVAEAGGVGEQIGRQVAQQIAIALREAPVAA